MASEIAVYRVEVGGATYWMRLDDDASHDAIVRALRDVDDQSKANDIGKIAEVTGDALHEVVPCDGDDWTINDLAKARPAPHAFACSEWS